ncbi:hypothetical protein ACOMHN_015730 [Nucella lapillus]
MSFETVFEEWLQKQEGGGSGEGREGPRRQHGGGGGGGGSDVEDAEMPVIQREVWREEDIEDMPVLQKMVDLPPGHQDRKLGSPPPPALQITLSLTETYKRNRKSKNGSKNRAQDPSLNAAGGKEDDYDGYSSSQHTPEIEKKAVVSRIQAGQSNVDILQHNFQQDGGQESTSLKEKTLLPCQAKSALTELTQLSQVNSPMLARGSEVDAVRSPECDLPMEPDSTSEFLTACNRLLRARKGSKASQGEVSPWRVVSPGARFAGLRTLNNPGSNSDVLVRIEENAAECDSTSMFMNSPSAISPASQGEIEERVCPVLADHEDGASPSHFVCRCRSLPPPADLMNKDGTLSTPSQPTVGMPHSVRCQGKSKPWTPLVSRACSLDDDPAPDLEKVAPSLDLMATPRDSSQSDHDSPPVLTLPEQEAQLKRLNIEHSQEKDVPVEVNQQEAPPLIRYGPEPPPQASPQDLPPSCTKYRDSPPWLSSNDFHSQEKCRDNDSPPVLSSHKQEGVSKPIKSKRRTAVCDFTSNIDWETAVVETVENPPSLTKYDGEFKPGIVIKIRTKGRTATTQSAQPAAKPEPVPQTVAIKRKQHTVDNTETLSRLRKRSKSGDVDKSAASAVDQEQQACSAGSKAVNTQHKVNGESGHSRVNHTKPKEKKLRHNVVQLGGDLKVWTHGLSVKDSRFAQCSVELSRLQTLTHELVGVLFPRLQPQLIDLAPESGAFVSIIDEIILSLERSTSEETVLDCDSLHSTFQKLSLNGGACVPVFSPQVVLCSSPGHVLEDLRSKACCLLQLLLPDLTASLTQSLSHSSEKLEMFLRKVILANINKAKVVAAAK